MIRIATRSELLKLSDTLALELDELAFLEALPPEELRALRAAIYEQMLAEDRIVFRRLARVVGRLPVTALTRMTLRVGPLIAARIAAELPTRIGAEVAERLPPEFLADVCRYVDPRRTRDLFHAVPDEKAVAVALVMVERGDHMTLSRFADFLTDGAIKNFVDHVPDERDLLRVAFFIGSKNLIDHIFALIPEERVRRLVRSIGEPTDELLAELLSLLIHVNYRHKRALGDLVAAQDEALLAAYVRAAHEQDLWGEMMPVVAAMSPDAREKAVNLSILREPAVQERIIAAADERRLWGILLPMIELMDDDNRVAVAGVIAKRPFATLENAADAALMGEAWNTLLDLVGRMPAAKQEEFAGIARRLGEVDADLLGRIAERAAAAGVGARF